MYTVDNRVERKIRNFMILIMFSNNQKISENNYDMIINKIIMEENI